MMLKVDFLIAVIQCLLIVNESLMLLSVQHAPYQLGVFYL